MKVSCPTLSAIFLVASLASCPVHATDGFFAAPAAADSPAPAEQPKAHPVKGVIMGLMVDKTALLVKHEEVPGVMRAMTMMFKVDPAVLEKVKRGDAITGLMSRRADGWWLTEVAVLPPAKI